MIVKWCQKCENDLKVHIAMYTCELANYRHCCGTGFPSAHALKSRTRYKQSTCCKV